MPADVVEDLVERALAEDVGAGDVTSAATVPEGSRAVAEITQKAPGVISGLAVAEAVFRRLDPGVALERRCAEGERRDGGPVLGIAGDARALLAAERTALNLLGRLSGVATTTERFVREVAGTGAVVVDTRKTTPGLRTLEKAAVVHGGGVNHRVGLFDEVLIKENHAAMAGGVGAAVRAAAAMFPQLPLQVEARTLAELDEALEAGARRILLDNMSLDELRAARARTDAELEASGGVSLESLRGIAGTGVDRISVGALTHSAPVLDLSLLVRPGPAA
jgi:nicotinate-nucleotide pyrophosphorylase (carboxylating)